MEHSGPTPGLILVGTGIFAFVIALGGFALAHVGVGIAAAVIALLAVGAGLDWLATDRRRVRQAERDWMSGCRGEATSLRDDADVV